MTKHQVGSRSGQPSNAGATLKNPVAKDQPFALRSTANPPTSTAAAGHVRGIVQIQVRGLPTPRTASRPTCSGSFPRTPSRGGANPSPVRHRSGPPGRVAAGTGQTPWKAVVTAPHRPPGFADLEDLLGRRNGMTKSSVKGLSFQSGASTPRRLAPPSEADSGAALLSHADAQQVVDVQATDRLVDVRMHRGRP